MPYLETVEELAESLATSLGIYATRRFLLEGDESSGHHDECPCRQCWCGRMERRIREAVRNEGIITT